MSIRAHPLMIGVVVVMVLAVGPAFAQAPSDTGANAASQTAPSQQPSREQLETQVNILKDYIARLRDNAAKQSAELNATIDQLKAALAAATPTPDPTLVQAETAARLRELQYAKEKFDIAVDGYWEQRINNRVALILLVLMVLAGICFSAYQLWKSTHLGSPLKIGAKPDAATATAQSGTSDAGSSGSSAMASDLQISGAGANIRITSTVIGVLVLIVSLAFFYIYMKELTSIRVIGDLGGSTKVTKAGPTGDSAKGD